MIAEALAAEGLVWLILAACAAGLVRGFSGFGTAMVFLPVAGQIMSPFEALTAMIVMDIVGPLPLLPRALRDGHPRDVLRLGVAALICLPLGVFVLSRVEPEVFRYGVSLLALVLLAFLVSGIRYRGQMNPPLIYATGGLGGFLAGSSGLAGPPVILLYMASPLPPAVIRANTLSYLIFTDALMIVVLAISGILVPSALVIGAILIVPYGLFNMIGARIFDPGAERIYRAIAYLIIAASALSGLPVFD